MNLYTKPVMRDEEFRLIKEFVAEMFGLVLDEGRESFLTQKIIPRLEELRLTTFAEYYAYLKYAPLRGEEQQRFISLLTNNETYFFREEAQLELFSREILPALKEKKLKQGVRRIRILSAGCSSGEEVYTLAMLLLESGHFLWDWDLLITGVDIDANIIATAERGVYTGRAFQTTPANYIDRYFSKCADGLQVRDALRNITRFTRGNLLQLENMFIPHSVDIIFCRNVLIYFGEETTRRVMTTFAQLLEPEGLLFLGHSESLARIATRFLPQRFPGAIIYRKRD